MLAVVSVTSFAGGAAAACIAERIPAREKHLHLIGGALLILGLVLVGTGLPVFR